MLSLDIALLWSSCLLGSSFSTCRTHDNAYAITLGLILCILTFFSGSTLLPLMPMCVHAITILYSILEWETAVSFLSLCHINNVATTCTSTGSTK